MSPPGARKRKSSALMALGLALAVGLILAGAAPASAVPARPATTELIQPNGTTFRARLYGDEWSHGYEALGGHTVVKNRRTGYWEYAVRRHGRLAPGGLRAGIARPIGVPSHVREAPVAPHQTTTFDSPNLGTQPSLALLVEYEDEPHTTDPADWNASFFGPTNSVRDYYDEVSYSQLDLAPAAETHGTIDDGVVGWLQVGAVHPDVNGDSQQITRDAIVASDDFVDYAGFDIDNNDFISTDELHITVIVAGYETSYGNPCGKSVWGHNWELFGGETVDGVQVGVANQGGGYNQFGERHCDTSEPFGTEHIATIGIMAHEMGHDLQLPDLYDTNPNNGDSEGVGEWSVMASGAWTQATDTDYAGSSPVHMDAWSKWYEGWLTPQQITGTQTVSLTQTSTDPGVVQLRDNPGGVDWVFTDTAGTGEYFLVENRQPDGYDAGLPGCGLLIWHIDETRSPSNFEANANENRKLVDLEEADGRNDLDGVRGSPTDPGNRGDAGDPYRGARVFNASSDPNSNLYNDNPSLVTVSDFSSSCAETMTATFSTTEQTTTTLKVVKTANKVKASGSLTPDHPGELMTVMLYKKRSNGTWKKISTKHPALNVTSDYKASFSRPGSGRCKIKSVFPADDDHLGSSKTKQFRC